MNVRIIWSLLDEIEADPTGLNHGACIWIVKRLAGAFFAEHPKKAPLLRTAGKSIGEVILALKDREEVFNAVDVVLCTASVAKPMFETLGLSTASTGVIRMFEGLIGGGDLATPENYCDDEGDAAGTLALERFRLGLERLNRICLAAEQARCQCLPQ